MSSAVAAEFRCFPSAVRSASSVDIPQARVRPKRSGDGSYPALGPASCLSEAASESVLMVADDPSEPDCRPITGLEELANVRMHSDATGARIVQTSHTDANCDLLCLLACSHAVT